MGKKKSVAVLLVLLQKKLAPLKGEERQDAIKAVETQLVYSGVITQDDIVKEEAEFSNFVKNVSKYIEEQHMSREDAMQLALQRYPQYRNAQELLN